MKIAEALKHLGVDKEATKADLKQAYKDLARIWHPDRFQSDKRLEAKAEAQIKVINEAKTVALDYLNRHGHFRFVGRTRSSGPRSSTDYSKPPRAHNEHEVNDTPKEEPKARPRPKPKPKPEPEREPEPEPQTEPEPATEFSKDFYDDESSFADYLPGSSTLIATILVAVLIGFLFILGSSFSDSPRDRVEAYRNKSKEQKAALSKKPKTVIPTEEIAPDIFEEEAELEVAYLDTFFTLGSDKEWVSLVQGAPLKISGPLWRYGHSTVLFSGNAVIGWESSELSPLNIGMPSDSTWSDAPEYFYVGSKKADVAALQGAPDIIDGNQWSYGEALVRFEADAVVFWENDIKNTLLAEEPEELEVFQELEEPEDAEEEVWDSPSDQF